MQYFKNICFVSPSAWKEKDEENKDKGNPQIFLLLRKLIINLIKHKRMRDWNAIWKHNSLEGGGGGWFPSSVCCICYKFLMKRRHKTSLIPYWNRSCNYPDELLVWLKLSIFDGNQSSVTIMPAHTSWKLIKIIQLN